METENQITVKINGETKTIPGGLTISGMLEHLNIKRVTAIVELNKHVIDRTLFEQVSVNEADELEIVRFVGGG